MTVDGLRGADPLATTALPQLIRAAAAAYVAGGQPETVLGFADLDHQSATLAKSLVAHGVGKHSRIGLIYDNNTSFALAFAAIARIGAAPCPSVPSSRPTSRCGCCASPTWRA